MGRGVFVVLIGSDGSGKSSLCRDLPAAVADLGPSEAAYFGSGDGPSSPLRWPLVKARSLVERRRPAPSGPAQRPSSAGSSAPTDPASRLRGAKGFARAVWAVTLAAEKSAKLKRARAARDAGTIVIADRYPQAQMPGINDGPLLHPWRERGVVRGRLAAWEARPYLDAERHGPDLVLRLVVSQANAEARRPEHDPADLARRRAIVLGLQFRDPATTVVDLDADAPYPEVLAAATAAIRTAAGSTAPLTPSLDAHASAG